MDTGSSKTALAVGFDGSPASNRALAFAFDLAHSRGQPVFLVHASQRDDRRAEPTTDEEAATVQDAIAAAVAGWSARASREEVRFTAVVREGDPVTILLAVAREVGASQIVVGTRGLGSVARVVLGSVSAGVLAQAKVPVTVVP